MIVMCCSVMLIMSSQSSQVQACACPIGFQTELGLCAHCPADYYKPNLIPGPCLPCPLQSHAPSHGSAKCQCFAGFTSEYTHKRAHEQPLSEPHPGGQCRACTSGTFKPLEGGMECTECPVGAYGSPTNSTNATQCAVCPRGMLKLAAGDAPCQGPFFGSLQVHTFTKVTLLLNLLYKTSLELTFEQFH